MAVRGTGVRRRPRLAGDRGDVLLARPDLAPWGMQEEAIWVAGSEGPAKAGHDAKTTVASGSTDVASGVSRTAPSRVFPDTGYVVMRDGNGGHAVFDVGPHGYMNGGHAHADALSMTLSLEGRPFLVDPGTATYTMDPPGFAIDSAAAEPQHGDHRRPVAGASEGTIPLAYARQRALARLATPSAPRLGSKPSHDGYAPVRHRRSAAYRRQRLADRR